MVIEIPKEARTVLDVLHREGYEAYVVGGCVRDSILGRTPGDWDITTSALPQEVKQCFRRTVDTGIQHGTVTVLIGDSQFEVTTYRIDGDYEDGRHPKSVAFTRSLLEDLKRRDFTINAMAYSEESGIIDEFGGLEDLENGLIKAVGDPKERFSEDALRMMRAVRFSAQLGYDIDAPTVEAIRALAPNLKKVSAERIRVELEKLLISQHPDRLRLLVSSGLSASFMPELDACMACEQNNPHHCFTVGEHIVHAVMAVRAEKVLRLTMLLHDIGKPACRTTDEAGVDHFHGHVEKSAEMANEILRRLKYDNKTRKDVVQLVRFHDRAFKNTKSGIRHGIVAVGQPLFPLLMEVKEADVAAQSDHEREGKYAQIDMWRTLYEEVLEAGDCLDLKHLAVTGKDLIEAGVGPGVMIGETMNRMLEDVLGEPSHNTKEYLMAHYTGAENG